MQFGFVPGRDTTDAILIFRQLQEKYLATNKPLNIAFVDLEKAFDSVPRKVPRWALRSVGVEEWAIRIIQDMYTNARSPVGVNRQIRDTSSKAISSTAISSKQPLRLKPVCQKNHFVE